MATITHLRIRPSPDDRLPGRLTCTIDVGPDAFAQRVTLRTYNATIKRSHVVGAGIVFALSIQDAPFGVSAGGRLIVDLGGVWLDQSLLTELFRAIEALPEYTKYPDGYAIGYTDGGATTPAKAATEQDADIPF